MSVVDFQWVAEPPLPASITCISLPGEEGRELPMQPAGKVPHRSIDAHHGGLCQPLLLQRFHKGLGHGDKPLVWPIMLVELLVEGEEALQVALLGLVSPGIAPRPR